MVVNLSHVHVGTLVLEVAVVWTRIAMTSIVDSAAHFRKRALEVGLTAPHVDSLVNSGVASLGAFAYSFGQPGQAINDNEFSDWVRANIDVGANIGCVSSAKRLLFEAQTILLASLKELVTSPDASSSRKLPVAEREAKMQALKQKLSGVLVSGTMDPGHTLLDSVTQMYEANQLKYVAPEKCVSRTHELTHAKQPTKVVELEAERLVVKEQDSVPDAQAGSGLLLLEALKRRGLALVFADCITHSIHEKYLQQLFAHLHRDPPPGYSKCTLQQLVAADKAVWTKLIEDCVKPRRNEAGVLELDTALAHALESYEVSFLLLPMAKQKELPKRPEKRQTAPKEAASGKGKGSRFQPYGKGKGSAGKKGKSMEIRVPKDIRDAGGVAFLPTGEAICFNYNLNGCDQAADGASCSRGLHVCAKCFKAHGLAKHGN